MDVPPRKWSVAGGFMRIFYMGSSENNTGNLLAAPTKKI